MMLPCLHIGCFQGDKYKDKEPTALDLFKECHYNKKKKSYTDVVQAAIVSQLQKTTNHQFLPFCMARTNIVWVTPPDWNW